MIISFVVEFGFIYFTLAQTFKAFCSVSVFSSQRAQRAPKARAAGVDPPAETQQVVSGNHVQEDHTETQAR